MTESASESFSPPVVSPRSSARSTVEALFRFKYRAVMTFLLVVAVAALYLLFAQRTYESTAKLMMRVGRENITLDPTATIGQTILVQKTHESEINTALEILGSRSTLEKVVAQLHAEGMQDSPEEPTGFSRLLGDVSSLVSSWFDSFAEQAAKTTDPASPTALDLERGVRRLMRHVTVSAPKESMVISLQARADSPTAAQQVVGTLTEVFMTEHARLNQTSGSYEFFQQQADELERQLNATQKQLSQRRKEFGLVTVEGKQKILEDRMRDVSLSELQTQRQIQYTRSKISQLERSLADVPAEMVTQKQTMPNSVRDAMRSQLYALELEKSQLPYTADHPLAKALAESQRTAASIVAEQMNERTQSQTGVNPTYQLLDAEVRRLRSDLTALESQAVELQRQKNTMEADLVALNDQQLEIQKLEREATQLAGSYATHVANREQARIDEELRSQHISNVNIIQPASYVTKAVTPKKAVTLMAGLLAALFGSVGVALGSELVDPSMKSTEQLQHTLQLPVLLELPRDQKHTQLLHKIAAGRLSHD